MVGSRLKADVGKVESGVARGDVDKYEVSLNVVDSSPPKRPDSFSVLGLGKYVVCCGLGSCTDDAACPKSSWLSDGRKTIGGSVSSGGIVGWRSSGDSLAVEGRDLYNLLGETGEFWEKSAVESTLIRLEKRFLAGVAFEARLEAVEMDQRLRLRKPSLKPPRLLDREWVLDDRRRVFLGETESSTSRSFTGSFWVGAALKGSWRGGCFQLSFSLTAIRGGGRRDEVRGSEPGEKVPS